MITKTVHEKVFHSNFDERNLFTAQIAVVKIKGITIYLPIRINNSDRKDRMLRQTAFPAGRIKAATMPNATPIKYLIQTFIGINYNIH